MNQLEQYLQQYFELPEEESQKLKSLFEPISIAKGDHLEEVGKRCRGLGFLQSGYLRIHNLRDGKEITQWIVSPGEAVTDLAGLVFETPCRWNIEAISDCELYFIAANHYRQLHEQIPSWPILEKLFIAKCFLILEDRVNNFIALSAEERYLELFNYKRELFRQVPQHYMASMLGMTPETMSRIRKKMIS